MNDETRDRSLEQMLESALRGSARQGSDACPDAEMLAAWSENGLTPTQRSQIETHVAECARCQAHVAALARSGATADPQPVLKGGWLSWRWVVPAAAGATALALLVATQPSLLRRAQKAAPVVAKVESTASPSRQDTRGKSAAKSSDAAALPSVPAEKSTARPKQSANSPARAPSQGVSPSAPNPTLADREARKESIDTTLAETVTSATAPPRPPPKIPAETTRAAGAAQPPGVMKSLSADALAPPEIVSSDPSIRWRIRGSEVDHTVDAGATWTKQPAAVTVPLTAGASPSPDVCWLVGRQGTVLRSTDGRTWQAVTFPETIDLVGITTTGADQATVTTADGRRFITADGGKTWASGGLQEFKATSF